MDRRRTNIDDVEQQLHSGNFEIVPRTRFHLREGSFRFNPRARCCFGGRQARPGKSEAKRMKNGIAVHLSDPEGAVGELGGDTSSPSFACIAFRDWQASAKPVLKPFATTRHPKFGNSARGFSHNIGYLGVPQGFLILVSRSLLCSGSCPFPPQKTRFFKSRLEQRVDPTCGVP